jgi:S-formylglutathione hydrolase FrmB
MKLSHLLLALLLAPAAGAEVRNERFAARSLGREVACAVQLPPSYGRGTTRYPVLYVLHGLFESQAFWEQRGLAAIVDGQWAAGTLPEMLVVAVDGGDSFFANARAGRYEDLVTQDLIAHVEATYRVLPGREGRVLAGVSMGGYAALRIAFTHPELYRAVATHSAMLLAQIPSAAAGAGRGQMAAFHAAFGDPIDPALWAAADPLQAGARVEAGAAPALYFDCGADDRYGLAAGHRALDRLLTERKVAHTFALLPGDHGYEYVRSVLPRSLAFLGDALRNH